MRIKCKHCCKTLFTGDPILCNSHHEIKQHPKDVGCADELDCCSYMTLYDKNIPQWIMDIINKESWTEGKLYCPYCNKHIGSFTFINERTCSCEQYIKPPIKILNSKVDVLY